MDGFAARSADWPLDWRSRACIVPPASRGAEERGVRGLYRRPWRRLLILLALYLAVAALVKLREEKRRSFV